MAEELLLKALELTVSGGNYKQGQEEIDKLRRSDELGYLQCLLKIVSNDRGDASIRLTACILLKNTVRNHWETEQHVLCDAAANLVKESILPLAVASSKPCQGFLYETVRIISQAQFPHQWPLPLPWLLQQYVIPFNSGQVNSPDGLVLVANAAELLAICLEKFLYAEASNELLSVLKEILMCSQERFLTALKLAAAAVITGKAGDNDLVTLSTLRISLAMTKCIYYLHGVDLPEYFEDNLKDMMTIVAHMVNWRALNEDGRPPNSSATPSQPALYIKYRVNTALCNSSEDDPWLTDQLKSYCFKLVSIYASRYTEEYQPYVRKMTAEVVAALCDLSAPGQRESVEDETKFHSDAAITDGIQSLTKTLQTRWEENDDPFSAEILSSILQSVIRGNMQLSERDLQEMIDEPMNFINNDLAGLQRAAKRESLQELISNLIRRYPPCADAFVASCKEAMGRNDAPLVQECACFLLSSLCNETQTRARGVTKARRVEDLLLFIQTQVLPKLTNPVSNDGDILLVASYLKLIALYRNFIPQESLENLVRCSIQMVMSDNLVIHSYAANFIDKVLLLRYSDKQPYIRKANLKDDLNKCLATLRVKIQSHTNFSENEYTFKLFWRLCSVADLNSKFQCLSSISLVQDYADVLKYLFGLAKILCEKGGGNPKVCHYLFESIGTLLMKPKQLDQQATLGLQAYALEVLAGLLSFNSVIISCYSYQLVSALIYSVPADPQIADPIRQLYARLIKESLELLKHISDVNDGAGAAREILPTTAPSIVQMIQAVILNAHLKGLVTSADLSDVVLRCATVQLNNRKSRQKLSGAVINTLVGWLTTLPVTEMLPFDQVMNELLGRAAGASLNGERNFHLLLCCYLMKTPNFQEIVARHRVVIDSILGKIAKYSLDRYEKYIFQQTVLIRLKGLIDSSKLAVEAVDAPQKIDLAQEGTGHASLVEGEFDDSTSFNSLQSLSSQQSFRQALVQFGMTAL